MRIAVICLLTLIACSRDEDFTPVYNVPEELQPIVDTFIYEASQRGVSLTITNLIIQYSEAAASVCGSCNSNALSERVQKVITINANTPCWTEPLELENLVFHELGHCVLGKGHTDARLPNGEPKSMMVENNVSLYSPCVYQVDDKPCNNTFKRDYYLDELFNENTPVPPWGE